MKQEKIRPLRPRLIRGLAAGAALPLTVAPEAADPAVREPVICFEIRPEAPWRKTDVIVLSFESDLGGTLTVELLFFRGEEALFSLKNDLLGGLPVTSCYELKYLDSSRHFPENLRGHLKRYAKGLPTDPASVDRAEIRVYGGRDLVSVTLSAAYLTDELPDLTVTGAPLADPFGQRIAGDWRGKVRSEKELVAYLREESEKAGESAPPPDFDRFGGFTGFRFEQAEHFTLREHEGRAWLVDPDGGAFFSNGVCYQNRFGVFGVTDGFESLFARLPDEARFPEAYIERSRIPEYRKRNGAGAGVGQKLVNFARANMMRAFGPAWREEWLRVNVARMKKWGFNTISVGVNRYPDEDVLWYVKRARVPYCVTLMDFPQTKTRLYRDLPDVFSPEYEEKCRVFARQIEPFADDPFFLGYFLTNEPEWMFQKDADPARILLSGASSSETRKAAIGFLKERYADAAALSRAWELPLAGFDDLLRPVPLPAGGKALLRDLADLNERICERYSRVPSRALAAAAPGILNLGMRFSSVGKGQFGATAGFDVYSFNCYKAHPGPVFDLAEKSLTTPYLVGEWHIGAREGGLLSGGIVCADTQRERGRGCAAYLQEALLHPRCVGVHYFEWNDQPLLGRFDGENKQIGLIDVCNRPYEDCIAPFSRMARQMYRVRTGQLPPEKIDWTPCETY